MPYIRGRTKGTILYLGNIFGNPGHEVTSAVLPEKNLRANSGNAL